MEELMNGFKQDLEKALEEWQETMEQLVSSAMFNLSFFEGDADDHYLMLQSIMIDVLREQFGGALDKNETLSH